MNKPITMRVRQATNGNKGVQEPLLDVGAAGVRGGAATRKQPSPLKANMDPQPKEETTKVDATESAGAIATGNTANVADDKKEPETKKRRNP